MSDQLEFQEVLAALKRGERVKGPHSIHEKEIEPCPCPGFNHTWRTLFCDFKTDILECSRCGAQRTARCNFDDEYA